jgi:hypothetical protein
MQLQRRLSFAVNEAAFFAPATRMTRPPKAESKQHPSLFDE